MRFNEVDDKYKIDIISFLRNYLGISSKDLKQNKLTHRDLITLFPSIELIRVPYIETYKNPEKVYNGNYLIVYDANYELIVYKNPLIYSRTDTEVFDNNYEERKRIELPDLTGLSKDELLRLRRQVRKIGEYRKAGEITKQIRKVKRREPKKYREEKEELKYLDRIIEEEDYEKVKRR